VQADDGLQRVRECAQCLVDKADGFQRHCRDARSNAIAGVMGELRLDPSLEMPLAPAAPDPVGRLVGDNSVDPRVERRGILEAAEPADDGEAGVLCDVRRGVPVAGEPPRASGHGRHHAPEQRLKRIQIATLGRQDQ
jgi:hypothetical protein